MQTVNKQAIKNHEGLRLTAYKDGGGVWTIGYGHTGSDVREGLTIPLSEAERLLTRDLRVAEGHVNDAVKVKLTQNQFDALVSFTYNLGGGAFRSSTLLKLLNAGDYEWALENGYEPDDFLNETVLLQKSYSKIIEFYIAKNDGTYAQVHAYHSSDEGLFDITIESEGLKKSEELVEVKVTTFN